MKSPAGRVNGQFYSIQPTRFHYGPLPGEEGSVNEIIVNTEDEELLENTYITDIDVIG